MYKICFLISLVSFLFSHLIWEEFKIRSKPIRHLQFLLIQFDVIDMISASQALSFFHQLYMYSQQYYKQDMYQKALLLYWYIRQTWFPLFLWKIPWQAQSISFVSGKTGIAISVRYLEFLGTTSKANIFIL